MLRAQIHLLSNLELNHVKQSIGVSDDYDMLGNKGFTQKRIVWCYFGSNASVHSNFQAKKEKIEGNMKGDGFQNGGSLIVTSSKNIFQLNIFFKNYDCSIEVKFPVTRRKTCEFPILIVIAKENVYFIHL